MKNRNLGKREKKIYSQNGEDGIIEFLLDSIGIENRYYVEFGVQDAAECNSRYLRERCHFSGLLMDGSFSNHSIHLFKEFVTKENINQLFEKYKVPCKFDLLSIDIDYNDLWVWRAIHPRYAPNIVVIEYNATFPPPISVTVPYQPDERWDGTSFFGASLSALNLVAEEKGYSLVYCENLGVNAFFVRNECLKKWRGLGKELPEDAYKEANYGSTQYKFFGKNVMGHSKYDETIRQFVSYPSGEPVMLMSGVFI
jgi:hypothetical protein